MAGHRHDQVDGAEWWSRLRDHTLVDCRWDPDTDYYRGGFCRDPDNLSRRELRRCRRFLDMLLYGAAPDYLVTARKIVAAHPQLRAEYAKRIEQRAKEMWERQGLSYA
jgi:hypothetical protein